VLLDWGHSRYTMKTNEVMNIMYKTKDFYLVSTLVLFGYKIKEHINLDNKSVFFFEEDEGLRALVQDYFYDKVRVSPHQFQSSIKTVKSLMYN
jgi:hypothetical protein